LRQDRHIYYSIPVMLKIESHVHLTTPTTYSQITETIFVVKELPVQFNHASTILLCQPLTAASGVLTLHHSSLFCRFTGASSSFHGTTHTSHNHGNTLQTTVNQVHNCTFMCKCKNGNNTTGNSQTDHQSQTTCLPENGCGRYVTMNIREQNVSDLL